MRKASKVITVLVFIFLYFPIIILAVASFSSGTDIAEQPPPSGSTVWAKKCAVWSWV